MIVRDVLASDASQVSEIYNYYVQHTPITFEYERVSAEQMSQRFRDKLFWIVCELNGDVHGYAHAGRWRERKAYDYTVEVGIYLRHGQAGAGLGTRLYGEILSRLRATEMHVAVGSIALPNSASVRLHERFGFEKVAHHKEVGFKFQKWIDIGIWQLML